jgi:hypothetical protein
MDIPLYDFSLYDFSRHGYYGFEISSIKLRRRFK